MRGDVLPWHAAQLLATTRVAHGPGPEERVRSLAPHGVAASLDRVGTREATEVASALVADRTRVMAVAGPRAAPHGLGTAGSPLRCLLACTHGADDVAG